MKQLHKFAELLSSERLFVVSILDSEGVKACKSDGSRQELSNEYLLSLHAKFGFDTVENEPQKICQKDS